MRCIVVAVAAAILLLTIGCTTRYAVRGWERKASTVAIGTPRAEIETALPPASIVVDPRSGPGAGQLAYWVDRHTLVRFWIDENEALAKPISVEAKKRPEEANQTIRERP